MAPAAVLVPAFGWTGGLRLADPGHVLHRDLDRQDPFQVGRIDPDPGDALLGLNQPFLDRILPDGRGDVPQGIFVAGHDATI